MHKSIPVCIILTLVTCGIYGLYWYYTLLDNLYFLNDLPSNAGMDLVLTIVTCGLYGVYMAYQMGRMASSAQAQRSLPVKDNGVLYVLLFVVGLGIIAYCIMQADINEMA